jgi:hypothetical protein
LLSINEFVPDLEVKMKVRGMFPDKPQDSFCPVRFPVEGGVKDKYLGDATTGQEPEFRLNPVQREPAGTLDPGGVAAVRTAEVAATGELPQHAGRAGEIDNTGKKRGGESVKECRGMTFFQGNSLIDEGCYAVNFSNGPSFLERGHDLHEGDLSFADYDKFEESFPKEGPGFLAGLRPPGTEDQCRTALLQGARQLQCLIPVPDIGGDADGVGAESEDRIDCSFKRNVGKEVTERDATGGSQDLVSGEGRGEKSSRQRDGLRGAGMMLRRNDDVHAWLLPAIR